MKKIFSLAALLLSSSSALAALPFPTTNLVLHAEYAIRAITVDDDEATKEKYGSVALYQVTAIEKKKEVTAVSLTRTTPAAICNYVVNVESDSDTTIVSSSCK